MTAENDDADRMPADDVHDRREFACDGQRWVLTVMGNGRTGSDWLTTGRLLIAYFAHAQTPGEAVLETWLVPGPLADLYESQLVDLLRSARPISDAWGRPHRITRLLRG